MCRFHTDRPRKTQIVSRWSCRNLKKATTFQMFFIFKMKQSCFMTEEYIAQTTEVHD